MGANMSACLNPSWQVLHDRNEEKRKEERAVDGQESLKAALKRMPKVSRSHVDNAKRVPLHRCARKGDEEGVRRLLEAGAPVNIRDHSRMTALMVACRHGHHLCVRYLINHGAEVLAVDPIYLKTSLHIAAEGGHARCLEVLLSSLYPVYFKKVDSAQLGPGQKARVMVQWGRQQNSQHKLLSERQFKLRMRKGESLGTLEEALDEWPSEEGSGKRGDDLRRQRVGRDDNLRSASQSGSAEGARRSGAVPDASTRGAGSAAGLPTGDASAAGVRDNGGAVGTTRSPENGAVSVGDVLRSKKPRGRRSRKPSLPKELSAASSRAPRHWPLQREAPHGVEGNDSDRYEDVLVETGSIASEASWLYATSGASTPRSQRRSHILRELSKDTLSGRTSLDDFRGGPIADPATHTGAPSAPNGPQRRTSSLPSNFPSSIFPSTPPGRPSRGKRGDKEQPKVRSKSSVDKALPVAREPEPGVQQLRVREIGDGQAAAQLRGDPEGAALQPDAGGADASPRTPPAAPPFYQGSKPRHRRAQSEPRRRPAPFPVFSDSSRASDSGSERGHWPLDGVGPQAKDNEGYDDVVTYRSMTSLVFALRDEDDEGDVRQLEEAQRLSRRGMVVPPAQERERQVHEEAFGERDGMVTPPLGMPNGQDCYATPAAGVSEQALLGALAGVVPTQSLMLRRNTQPKKKKGGGDAADDSGTHLQFLPMKSLGGKDQWGRSSFINMRSRASETALMLASGNGHMAAVELLLRHGGDVGATTRVPVDRDKLAAEEKAGAEYLFNMGPGSTALHYAAAGGSVDVLYLLLDAGAPLELRNATGMRAQDVAEQFKRHEAAAMLAAPVRHQAGGSPTTGSPAQPGSARRAAGGKSSSSLIGHHRKKSGDVKEKLRRAAIHHRRTMSMENVPAVVPDTDTVMSQLPGPREAHTSSGRAWHGLLSKHRRSATTSAENFTIVQNPIESIAHMLPRLQSMSSFPLEDEETSSPIQAPQGEHEDPSPVRTSMDSPLVTIKEETATPYPSGTPYPSSKAGPY